MPEATAESGASPKTHYLTVDLTVQRAGKDDIALSRTIYLEDLHVLKDNGTGTFNGFGAVNLIDGEVVYAQVRVWSYRKDGKSWNEVFIGNGCIEKPAGYYVGNYKMKMTVLSKTYEVERTGGHFIDGTGYYEVFGRPFLNPREGAVHFYTRNLPENTSPMLSAALSYNQKKRMTSYPHSNDDWSAHDWHKTLFDGAKNTHQTGSPRNVGDALPEAIWIALLESAKATQKAEEHLDALWGFVGQQCRRPIHFLHTNSSFWKASEYPKLIMGEVGPSGVWGATEFWGRNKFSADQKTPIDLIQQQKVWNGWDLEHDNVDQLVVAWLFYGSHYAYMQIMLLTEALLSWPHVRSVKTNMTPRVWGWGIRKLAWALYCNPFAEDRKRIFDGCENLFSAYFKSAVNDPISYVFDTYADPRHVFPTLGDLEQYYGWKGWLFPPDDPDYKAEYTQKYDAWRKLSDDGKINEAGLAYDNLRSWIVYTHVSKRYGSSQAQDILNLWSHVPPWQLAVAASGVMLFNDVVQWGYPKATSVAHHLLYCLMTQGYNPKGTFYESYGSRLPVKAGPGTSTTGVNVWTAGGLSMIYQLVPPPHKEYVRKAIMSVYHNSKEMTPSSPSLYSWGLHAVYHFGYAP